MDVWCLCTEALRRVDHPPKESYKMSDLVNRSEMESFMEVGQDSNWGRSAKGEKEHKICTAYQKAQHCACFPNQFG
jgi:hypothetical protein